jgi:hypothetical protein
MRRLLLLLACALAGCGTPPVNCTAEAVSSLNVTVLDPGGQRVCDATVTARDGSFSATLMALGPAAQCVYAGPFERAGTYVVTAEKAGFQTATAQGVTVTADVCHVKPVSLTLTLSR